MSSVLTRRKAAQPLRIIGFAAFFTMFGFMMVRPFRPISILGDIIALTVGFVCLSVSLWFRGERKEARQMCLLGGLTALALLYVWGAS